MTHLFFDRKGSEIFATCDCSCEIYYSSAVGNNLMLGSLIASAQGHSDVHVLHFGCAVHRALHQVKSLEDLAQR